MSGPFHCASCSGGWDSYLFQPLQIGIILVLEMDADSHCLDPGIVRVPWVIHVPFVHLEAMAAVSELAGPVMEPRLLQPTIKGAQIHMEGGPLGTGSEYGWLSCSAPELSLLQAAQYMFSP